jgi:Carbohydrate family 9 binding domain-like
MLKKIIVLLFVTLSITAQEKKFSVPQIEFNPNNYICYRSDQLIRIDGNIYDLQWANVPWTDLFVDIEGPNKPVPYQQTRVKMLWNDAYFYIAAELKESHVWSKIKARDAVIFYDNDFEVFIDPDNDTHNYYELELNAFNTVWDLLLIKPYRDGHKVAVTDWDIMGLKTAVQIQGTLNDASDTDSSWTIEIAIPWETFKELSNTQLPPKENDQWRVNFSRVHWETEIDNGNYVKAKNPETNKILSEYNWVWSPQGIIAMHYPEMWGFVQFSYKVVTHGEDVFIKNVDEDIKWLLRKIYYQQKTFRMNNKIYTDDILKLGFNLEDFDKLETMPYIEATRLGYQASIKSGNKIFTILEDGKIITNIIE